MANRPDPGLVIRAYRPDDAASMRRLAMPEIERSHYRSGPRSAIDGLVAGTDPDAHALVAVQDGAVVAFVLHGMIAGSEGASRVQLIVTDAHVRRRGIARRLVEAAVERLRDAGARFVAVELPDDPALAPALGLLDRSGFRIEARVAGFYRDDVDLLIGRRDLVPA
jgi:ribosomal protein S18 acetylase RimI-like enzyme